MINERRILDILAYELRGKVDLNDRAVADALRRAARRIDSDAMTDRQHAAKAASMVGAMVTRGRTRL